MCEEKKGRSQMSLYNLLFGTNENAPELLGMIGANKEYFSRFRDIELINSGTIIRVFTRLGGGNREDYQSEWQKIRKHELYIKDYDDDFDETYAHIEFNIPERYKETAKKMFKGEPTSFGDKFKKELEEMDRPGTEAYDRAGKVASKIVDAMESGNNIIGL